MKTIPTTTAAGRHDRGALWRWLGHGGFTAAGLLVLSGLGACGPDTNDPLEIQEWMLGVFSHRQPVDQSDTDGVIQYHVHDTLEVSALVVNVNGPVSDFRRVWEPRGNDSFAMFPAEEEPGSTAISEYLVRPKEGSSLNCGPYEVVTVYGPQASQPGPQPNPETIHRGAVCARPYDCTPPPEQPDACFGLHYTLEWCDEPPPPCEEPAG